MVVVLGIGNLLLSDEGLGVRALEVLYRDYALPDGVKLIDGGTLGLDLLYFIEDAERLLVLDAISGGGSPGTLYNLRGEEVRGYFKRKVSMHELGFQDVLGILELKGRGPEEIVVMGIEPKTIELGTDLSPEIEAKIPELVEMAAEQLRSWGLEVKKKDGKAQGA